MRLLLVPGIVMYTTDTITSILGYPKDMWVGRSFIDFVHPKDRTTFTNQITNSVTLPFGDQLKVRKSYGMKTFLMAVQQHLIIHQSFGGGHPVAAVGDFGTKMTSAGLLKTGNLSSFFCRLRQYNGLKQGIFTVKERKTVYNPFKLTLCFKVTSLGKLMYMHDKRVCCNASSCLFQEVPPSAEHTSSSDDEVTPTAADGSVASKYGLQSVCLIITAIPLESAYILRDQTGPFHVSRQSREGPDTSN